MTDILRSGAAWLEATRKAYASTPAVYHRGAVSVSLNVTIGRLITEDKMENDYSIIVTYTDFFITAADLVLSSAVVKPQAGDYLIYDGRKYLAQKAADGAYWRWSDSFATTIRFHAAEVKV